MLLLLLVVVVAVAAARHPSGSATAMARLLHPDQHPHQQQQTPSKPAQYRRP
jgi:hypothetical protein